jgi:hypothetical protein
MKTDEVFGTHKGTVPSFLGHTFAGCRSFPHIFQTNREGRMSSRSDQYLVKAAQCQQISDVAEASGTKRLYEMLASQWRQLAAEANRTDNLSYRRILVTEGIRRQRFELAI